ncbi:hypothetical protein UBN78_06720 [Helicobacter pylori]
MKIIDKLLRVKSRFGLWLLVNGFVSHCSSLTIPSLIPIGILLVQFMCLNTIIIPQYLKQGGCNKPTIILIQEV